MSQDGASPGWRLRSPVRRIVVRFAEVACPPEVRAGDVMGGLLAAIGIFIFSRRELATAQGTQ